MTEQTLWRATSFAIAAMTLGLCACQSGTSGASTSGGLATGTGGIGTAGSRSNSTSGRASTSAGTSAGGVSSTGGSSSPSTGSGTGSSTGLPPVGSVVTIFAAGDIYCFNTGLDAIYGLAIDPAGPIYVYGFGIYRVDPDGGALTIVVPELAASRLGTLTVESGDTILVADGTGDISQVVRLTASGQTFYAGNSGAECYELNSDGGFPVGTITGMTTDAAGNLFLSEAPDGVGSSNAPCYRIRKVAPDGTITIVGGVQGISGYIDGPPSQAELGDPEGIVEDGAGNLYVADSRNNVIRKVDIHGITTTFAGSGSPGFADGDAKGAAFNGPVGLAIDSQGNLYVADTQNNSIRRIDPSGTTTTLAGNGTPGFVNGTLGMNGTTELFGPTGVAVDALGRVFVAEPENCALRMITLSDGGSTGGTTGGTGGGTGTSGGLSDDGGCMPSLQGQTQFAGCGKFSGTCPCGFKCAADPVAQLMPSTFFDNASTSSLTFCELECQSNADCLYNLTACVDGVCALVPCGGDAGNGSYNSTCSMGDGATDGTCTTAYDDADAGRFATCYQAGTVQLGGLCAPNPTYSYSTTVTTHADLSEICEPGDTCFVAPGSNYPRCAQQCDGATVLCPPNQTCMLGAIIGGGVCVKDGGA